MWLWPHRQIQSAMNLFLCSGACSAHTHTHTHTHTHIYIYIYIYICVTSPSMICLCSRVCSAHTYIYIYIYLNLIKMKQINVTPYRIHTHEVRAWGHESSNAEATSEHLRIHVARRVGQTRPWDHRQPRQHTNEGTECVSSNNHPTPTQSPDPRRSTEITTTTKHSRPIRAPTGKGKQTFFTYLATTLLIAWLCGN